MASILCGYVERPFGIEFLVELVVPLFAQSIFKLFIPPTTLYQFHNSRVVIELKVDFLSLFEILLILCLRVRFSGYINRFVINLDLLNKFDPLLGRTIEPSEIWISKASIP